MCNWFTLSPLTGRKHHYVRVAGSLWRLIEVCNAGEPRRESIHFIARDVRVSQFPSAENHCHLHYISLRKEFFCLIDLHFKVMLIDTETQADSFYLGVFLLFLVLFLDFFLIVQILTEVHDFTYRRMDIRRHFDEVELGELCQFFGALQGYDPSLFILFVDQPYRTR